MSYYTASYIAAMCEVTPAAVSNWVARDVLPADLAPEDRAVTALGSSWLWSWEQAHRILEWHKERKAQRERNSNA